MTFSTDSTIASFDTETMNFKLIYQSIERQYHVVDEDILIGYSIPFGEPFTANSHEIAIEIFNEMIEQFA